MGNLNLFVQELDLLCRKYVYKISGKTTTGSVYIEKTGNRIMLRVL